MSNVAYWHAFYDPLSKRVKVADLDYSWSSSELIYGGRFYRQKRECYFGQAHEMIYSKDGKSLVSGIGISNPNFGCVVA